MSFQGVINLKNTDIDCYYVFVKTPSLEELVSDLLLGSHVFTTENPSNT